MLSSRPVAWSNDLALAADRPRRRLLDYLWASIVKRGRKFASLPEPQANRARQAEQLASALLSARGEASGAAMAQELLHVIAEFEGAELDEFLLFLSTEFGADEVVLTKAAGAYLAAPSPATATSLCEAAEPPRQELLRRINMAPDGTRTLVKLREKIPSLLARYPAVAALEADLRHLLTSWFNRGFLQLRQIDWNTSAAILEKLIEYEAVHEIQGWDDLRRRLASDRRCFAFFHPSLSGEPLIFVEVALVDGIAASVDALLDRGDDAAGRSELANAADTAVFYSISNCQAGLRGISFGNFLIKQVVEILRTDLPALRNFVTLSPIPGFARWLPGALADWPLKTELSADSVIALRHATNAAADSDPATLVGAALAVEGWEHSPHLSEALREPLLALCAAYLRQPASEVVRTDPVARFHLGNGARLERINWMANRSARGMRESWGMMVNYLYDPQTIEANHECYTQSGEVAVSPAVAAMTTAPSGRWRNGRNRGMSAVP